MINWSLRPGSPEWWFEHPGSTASTMNAIQPYLHDLHDVLPTPYVQIVLVLASVLCGLIIGMERQAREKPAGVRTLTLICLGSTIFTIASILMAGDDRGDRGRIAAQVVTGIGFLGAGAIIRDQGTVRGLTTGATIWAVAAIGVLNGVGYAAGGLSLAIVVLVLLLTLRPHEDHPANHRNDGNSRSIS